MLPETFSAHFAWIQYILPCFKRIRRLLLSEDRKYNDQDIVGTFRCLIGFIVGTIIQTIPNCINETLPLRRHCWFLQIGIYYGSLFACYEFLFFRYLLNDNDGTGIRSWAKCLTARHIINMSSMWFAAFFVAFWLGYHRKPFPHGRKPFCGGIFLLTKVVLCRFHGPVTVHRNDAFCQTWRWNVIPTGCNIMPRLATTWLPVEHQYRRYLVLPAFFPFIGIV